MKPTLTAFLLLLLIATARAEEAKAEGTASPLPQAQVDEIRARIQSLHERQAEYFRKVAAGEITPGEDLRKRWPLIQERLGELRSQIVTLNGLGADSPARPSAQDKLFGALQEIGIHLEAADHPPFTPRVLSPDDVAEMRRIEEAITVMEFGDRKKAVPVKVLTPESCFTLIHLPVPIVLQCRPGDTVYLAATTGGAFHNGLSLIELRADAQGIAKTTWASIGDAVADCDITIYSQAAIEPQDFRIKVVSPSLPPLDGLPQPEHLKGEIPRLKSKITTTKALVPNP